MFFFFPRKLVLLLESFTPLWFDNGILWEKGQKLTDSYLVRNYRLDFLGNRILAANLTWLISGPRVGLTVGWSSNSPPTVGRGQGRLFPASPPEEREAVLASGTQGTRGGSPDSQEGSAWSAGWPANRTRVALGAWEVHWKHWSGGLQWRPRQHRPQVVSSCSRLCGGNKRCGLLLSRSFCFVPIFGKVTSESGCSALWLWWAPSWSS